MVRATLLDESWRAVPVNVPLARHTVLAHLTRADVPDPPRNDIGLAVSEAVTNVVNHAYVGLEPGPMRVRVDVAAAEIEVMVQDRGSGMTPRPDTPGLGLGLPTIATISERFDIRAAEGGGTQLCMWFRTDPAAATLDG